MQKMKWLALCMISATALWSTAFAAQAPHALMGTWKLESHTSQKADGSTAHVLGENPVGYVGFYPDGRMWVLNTGSDRKRTVGPKATEAEAAQLYHSTIAYAGTYQITGSNTITYKVDISLHPNYVGQLLPREFRIEGDKLILSVKTPDPRTGEQSLRTVVFTRVK